MKKIFLFFCIVMTMCSPLLAAEDFYQFKNQNEAERFTSLIGELRCLVCQNQNLAESNAPLAADLRSQIYLKIRHGESDAEIIHYLVARYGSFILYSPPFNALTVGLWSGPFLILISGLSYLIFYLRKKSREEQP